jgi:hypothetical protein
MAAEEFAMTMIRLVKLVFLVAIGAAVFGAPATAQATRTWVSGTGDDANPCSRTAPCKTFAMALVRTAPGGIINCLDPGGFGPVVIRKSITIICDGMPGGILTSGQDGVLVQAAATDTVYLSGLTVRNSGGAGGNGINIASAASVHVANSTILGYNAADASGVLITASGGATTTIYIDNTIIAQNSVGITVDQTAGKVELTLDRTSLADNTVPIKGGSVAAPAPKQQ